MVIMGESGVLVTHGWCPGTHHTWRNQYLSNAFDDDKNYHKPDKPNKKSDKVLFVWS